MPSLTLKDIPPELLDRLRKAAASDRRSLMQQVLVYVESALARRESVAVRAARQLEAWRTLAGAWRSEETLEAEINAIYGERTPGRDMHL